MDSLWDAKAASSSSVLKKRRTGPAAAMAKSDDSRISAIGSSAESLVPTTFGGQYKWKCTITVYKTDVLSVSAIESTVFDSG
jgi:hypothetical protein